MTTHDSAAHYWTQQLLRLFVVGLVFLVVPFVVGRVIKSAARLCSVNMPALLTQKVVARAR